MGALPLACKKGEEGARQKEIQNIIINVLGMICDGEICRIGEKMINH